MDLVGPRAATLTSSPSAHDPTGAVGVHGVDGIPPLFARLCDDAALFPPGNAAAHDAVPAHREYRRSWYRDLVGPFLATAKHIPAVAEAARADPSGGPLPLVLVVPDGPAALAAAIQSTEREPGIELHGVELACSPEGSSADAAREAVWTLERELPPGVSGVVEVRRHNSPANAPANASSDAPTNASTNAAADTIADTSADAIAAALDVLAASPYRAKLRTGGTVAEAFPSEAELAAFIVGSVARSLPFKCTAGLHEAVRHTDPVTGFEHHGFLNILAATAAATQGADEPAVASVLAIRSGADLVATLRVLTPDAVIRTRRAFTAYGTCSIAEPLADLIKLGAL